MEERRRSRGPYAKSSDRRRQILDAARAAFAEHGFAASSLRDIADRAGLTHAGLQHHFSSKEALLVALLAERDADEDCRSRRLAADHGDGVDRAGPDLLLALVRGHQEAPELMGLWAELALAARHVEHPAHEYFVTRYQQARKRVAGHLESWAATGTLRSGVEPAGGAALFLAVLDGLQAQWLLDPSLDIHGPLRQFLRLLHEVHDRDTEQEPADPPTRSRDEGTAGGG